MKIFELNVSVSFAVPGFLPPGMHFIESFAFLFMPLIAYLHREALCREEVALYIEDCSELEDSVAAFVAAV